MAWASDRTGFHFPCAGRQADRRATCSEVVRVDSIISISIRVNPDSRGWCGEQPAGRKWAFPRAFLPQQPHCPRAHAWPGRKETQSLSWVPPGAAPTHPGQASALPPPPSKDTASTLAMASPPFSFLDEVTFSFNKTFPKRLVSSKMLTSKVGHRRQRILKKKKG